MNDRLASVLEEPVTEELPPASPRVKDTELVSFRRSRMRGSIIWPVGIAAVAAGVLAATGLQGGTRRVARPAPAHSHAHLKTVLREGPTRIPTPRPEHRGHAEQERRSTSRVQHHPAAAQTLGVSAEPSDNSLRAPMSAPSRPPTRPVKAEPNPFTYLGR